MHIGIISYDYDPPIGGLGIVAKTTVSYLRKNSPQNRYTVCSPASNADERVSTFAGWFWRKRGGCPFFSCALIFELPRLLKKYSFDLLHVHAGSGGVFLVRKPKCPLVVTSHHTYLQEAEIVFGSSWIKSSRKKLMGMLEARTYRLADRVVCVSKDTADFVISRYGIDAHKVSVIENGIEERSAIPAVQESKNVILFVGRLEQRKGIWVLFDAFKKLAATHGDLQLRFAGQDLEWGAMRQAIIKSGLSDRIAITGYLHEPMLLRELKSATVLVVPSLLEGFGLIAADAMKLGMCVIVSDAAGLKSLIDDGRTGLVFRSGDDAALAAAIQKAVADPELRRRLGEAAFIEAQKRFSYPDRVKDLQLVFDRVFGKN